MSNTEKAQRVKRELRYEYDFDEAEPLSQEYYEAVMPQEVKDKIAEHEALRKRKKKKPDEE